MRYWWVNQKQTYRQEIGEGYLWSPKRQQDGKRHFSYEYMKHVQPGDIIFSYANAAIIAVGVSHTHCYSFPKPVEFGRAGAYWADEGWKVDVKYRKLNQPVRTMDHIDSLRSFLPSIKSPIQAKDGSGNQAYLFLIDRPFALALANLIGGETVALISANYVSDTAEQKGSVREFILQWEDRIENELRTTTELSETDKVSIIKARRGQGKFRESVLSREPKCRITGVDKPEHLVASHVKPWRSANNEERLDPENGFMLTPTVDHLFDRGFISFEDDGAILLADVANREAMERMGIIGEGISTNAGRIREGQKLYLEWHRESVFLG